MRFMPPAVFSNLATWSALTRSSSYASATVPGRAARTCSNKLASQQQLDRTRLEQAVAVSALEQANETLKLLREGPRAEDIERARAELAARRSVVENAEQQLQYVQLKTPAAGVLSVRLAEAGEVVAAGRPSRVT